MAEINTYNPKKITLALGRHIASGFADDSFITIEPAGDGNSYVVGADGEVLISVDPSSVFTVKVALLQRSKTNAYLNTMYENLKSGQDGLFSVNIKDLIGKDKFTGSKAFVTKPASKGYGKAGTNREWEIVVVDGKHED